MPRGVPKSGRRNTRKYLETIAIAQTQIQEPVIQETDEEIMERIGERFEMLSYLTESTIKGDVRGVIVSGPPGLGKSYTIEKMLEENVDPDNYEIVKGFTRPTGIYQSLWKMASGGILVFDDCDSAFNDDIALNLLKSATDSTDRRTISWRAETKMQDENGELLPTYFEFNGSVIFITNYDFDAAIERQHRLAPHFEAMINRSFYLDLMLKSRRDYFLRIKQMVDNGMLLERGNTKEQSVAVLQYIERNINKFRAGDLSLRTAVKLGSLIKSTKNWERIANTTLLKQR